MTLTYETDLLGFKAWSGAKQTLEELTEDEIKTIEPIIEEMISSDCDSEAWSETALNDFLWFETDTIAEWLGYEDWDNLVEKHKNQKE